MFELCGKRAVLGRDRPSVTRVEARACLADIDHRLNGEKHALFQRDAFATPAVMQDIGRRMENPPDAVPAIIPNHGKSLRFGVLLNGCAYIAGSSAGAHLFDSPHHAVVGDLDQPLRFERYVADIIHPAGVTVPAVHDSRHVHVDDIAVIQDLVIRDTVADHMVHRSADGFGEAAIAERGRGGTGADDPLVAVAVDLIGGDSGDDDVRQFVENLGGKSSGFMHSRVIRRFVNDDLMFHGRSIKQPLLHFNVLSCIAQFLTRDVMTNPSACIILIGNEILSGRTQDKNLSWLSQALGETGIDVRRVYVIPDVRDDIVATVNEARSRFDYVFTTGGIGPTHDDITTEAVASAFGVKVEREAEAERRLRDYYQHDPQKINAARLKMADIPNGAELIDNPVSAAPGFRLQNVFVMAGVPSIMQGMFAHIKHLVKGGEVTRSVQLGLWIGEGSIAAEIEAVQKRFPEVEIGVYPALKEGGAQTTVVLRSIQEAPLHEALSACEVFVENRGIERIKNVL